MGMTREQLDAAVWGSGYGGKKHLVDRHRSRLQTPGAVGAYDDIRARCSGGITLAVVDTWNPEGSRFGEGLLVELERRAPCRRCREIAEAQGTPIYRQPEVPKRSAA
jgi:hypothetical protein